MADLKTSQEALGGSFTKDDLVRIARSGSNFALSAQSMLYESVTFTNAQTYITQGQLVPGKWYFISGVPQINYTGTTFLYAQAIDTTKFARVGYVPVSTPLGNKIWELHHDGDLDPSNFRWIETDKGTKIVRNTTFNGIIFTNFINTSPYLRNCTFLNSATYGGIATITTNTLAVQAYECTFEGVNINYTPSVNGKSMILQNCKIHNTILTNGNNPRDITMNNCHFDNCTITFSGTASSSVITLQNVRWQNVNVTIHGNPSGSVVIMNQSVRASISAQATPSFVIDGQWQTRAVNGWAGEAELDDYFGYSTVKMSIPFSASPSGTTPCWSSTRVYCADNTIVGEYLLEDNTLASSTTYNIDGISNLTNTKTHQVVIRPKTSVQQNVYNFTLKSTQGSMINNYDILAYHGVGAKAGELKSPNTTLIVRSLSMGTSQFGNQRLHLLPTGAHYD